MGLAHVRALIALLLCAGTLSAHEIGTTRVDAQFRGDGTYQIDVVTAPRSLLAKLEARAGVPRSNDVGRIQDFLPYVLDAAEVRFDDVRVSPRVTVSVDEYAATLRLTGEIPREARTFTWQFRLTYAAYALTLQNEGDATQSRQWLDGDEASAPFRLSDAVRPQSRGEVAWQYLVLGFTHILPHGLDHILFVLGLFLLARKTRPLLLQVTAFTVAHTITLGLTIYGLVNVSPSLVEPLIALSIVYVAVENLATTELKPWRVAIVFAFGLLHGMGFAGVLRELGVPRNELATALIAFNVGVEAGQVAVIAIAAAALALLPARERVARPASAAIAAVGVFWVVQRIAS